MAVNVCFTLKTLRVERTALTLRLQVECIQLQYWAEFFQNSAKHASTPPKGFSQPDDLQKHPI